MHAIINCGQYTFSPIFHCGLYYRAAIITDNLYTKQGNSSIFNPQFIIESGFKSRAGYNDVCTVLQKIQKEIDKETEQDCSYFNPKAR